MKKGIDMSQRENAEIMRLANKYRIAVLSGLGLLSILIGFLLTPSMNKIVEGFLIQQTATGLLDLNTFHIVGEGKLGVPFMNAGILLLLVMLSYAITNTKLNGSHIAAAFMTFGFGFCGKTLWNIWPTFVGVLLYAKWNQKKINTILGLAWFSCALSPLVSLFTFYIPFDGLNTLREAPLFSPVGFAIGVIVGIIAGYMIALFAEFLPQKHSGLTLYNAGMAAGLAGFVIYSIMKQIGLGHSAPMHEYPNINNVVLVRCMAVLLLYLGVVGMWIVVKEKGDIRTIVPKEYTGSAVEQFGFGATLVNMCVCGFVCLLYWFLTRTGNMSGPVYACMLTIVGFASNGITLRTMLPILCGSYLAIFVTGAVQGAFTSGNVLESAMQYLGSKNMLIAAFYACGMAPVVYKHGWRIGFLAAMIHSFVVPSTAILHGWMNLYNNGFCLGLEVTFVVPALLLLLKRYDKAMKEGEVR